MMGTRKLTKKQRGFVDDYADTGNGTQAALKNYDIQSSDPENVASVIAVENLGKPMIIEALKELGFDSSNAKRVVGEILDSGGAQDKDRLKAAEMVFKVNGDMAPDKHINVNVDLTPDDAIRELTKKLNDVYRSTGSGGDGMESSALGDKAQDQE